MNDATKLRARVLEAVRAEPSPTRDDLARRELVLVVLGFAAAMAMFFALGGGTMGDQSMHEIVTTAAAWGACAIAASWIALARLRHGMGVAREWRGIAAMATAPVLVGLFVGFARSEADRDAAMNMMATWKCLAATLAMATAPLVALFIARRASDATHPRATGAAIGAAAGAWGGVLIDVHCPSGAFPHVALGHAMPALILAIVGALVGKRALGVSSST